MSALLIEVISNLYVLSRKVRDSSNVTVEGMEDMTKLWVNLHSRLLTICRTILACG